MLIFLKHLAVQEQNEKSNERAFESMFVLKESPVSSSGVSFLNQSIAGFV